MDHMTLLNKNVGQCESGDTVKMSCPKHEINLSNTQMNRIFNEVYPKSCF